MACLMVKRVIQNIRGRCYYVGRHFAVRSRKITVIGSTNL